MEKFNTCIRYICIGYLLGVVIFMIFFNYHIDNKDFFITVLACANIFIDLDKIENKNGEV